MTDSSQKFYRALKARDRRFDGKFFTGVKTTGIYCRPVCPARPLLENVEFFSSALEAERNGYRPCRRCRPESAPFSPAWQGSSALVQRALRLLSADPGAVSSEEGFAERLGVTGRHLRRLFVAELGLSPKQLSDRNRLNFARGLLAENKMPIALAAETAGFGSLRRFNDAFRRRFHERPSDVRKKGKPGGSVGYELTLAYRPPFSWSSLLEFFGPHQAKGVDQVDGNFYERIFRLHGKPGWFRVTDVPSECHLRAKVCVSDPASLLEVSRRLRLCFDLDADPFVLSEALGAHPFFSPLVKRQPGLRVARGWDPFETAVCTVLGQLVSVKQASRLVAQLVDLYGPKGTHPVTGDKCHFFPTARELVGCDFSGLGTTGARKATLRELSNRVANGDINLAEMEDGKELRDRLLDIPGVGPWTAEYICLRALGDPDAFPAQDLVLGKALRARKNLRLEALSPWRAYAAVHLWSEWARSGGGRK